MAANGGGNRRRNKTPSEETQGFTTRAGPPEMSSDKQPATAVMHAGDRCRELGQERGQEPLPKV